MYRTTSFANTGWSLEIRPYVNFPGTSSAVIIACTPAMRRALVVSIDVIRAYGCGERRVAPHNMFSARISDEKENSPVTFATPSGRRALVPSTSRLLVEVFAVIYLLFFRVSMTAFTAAKIRPYPVQRQMLPEIASFTSMSLGDGLCSSR